MSDVTCGICDKGFTAKSWDERHTDPATNEDVHARCCPQCHPKPRRGQTKAQAENEAMRRIQ